ncbi:MAG TPA: hypothetical protein VMH23_04230 [Bacteroidota bacterium]|nr:hypothetical protein [Bacteroidota bacterium]
MKAKSGGKIESPSQQLNAFVRKFEPQDQALIRSLRRALRKRFPTAFELVYDNYNFFVIGYSATDRTSDAIISLGAGGGGVNLFFLHGAKLPDPKKILLGSGKQTRFIRVDSAKSLARPEVQELLTVASERAKTPLKRSGRGKLIIKSVSSKQRPRRKA